MKNFNLYLLITLVGLMVYSCNKENELTRENSSYSLSQSNETSYLESLDPDEAMAECFEYVYPVKVKIGKDEFTANNADELKRLLSKNPTTTSRPVLVFPLQVIILATKETKTVRSQEELNALTKECNKKTRPGGGGPIVINLRCFKYVYPLAIQLADGSMKRIASEEELIKTVKESKGRAAVKLVFPIKVIKSDGTELTINNESEYGRLQASCRKTRNNG